MIAEQAQAVYRNHDEFICVGVRERSTEVDFGVMWVERPGLTFPQWRVSWIEKTGELYATELRPGGGGKVYVLLVAARYEEVERLMDGWSETEGYTPLEWVTGRRG